MVKPPHRHDPVSGGPPAFRGRDRLAALGREARVLPSVLSADFAALAASIEPLEQAGAAVLHLDVMDGHFVPNITFGPPLVRSIREHSRSFLDVHLMIAEPLRYLQPFAQAGADLCTIHAEIGTDPKGMAEEARRLGIGLGIALRPSTPLDSAIESWAGLADLILIMSVEPGFGGQSFRPEAAGRLRRTREICRARGVAPILEVDGGIGPATASEVLEAGARWLVAGNAIFRAPDPVEAWRQLTTLAQAARPED